MNRITMACYALIASAIVLTAMVAAAASATFSQDTSARSSLLEAEALGGMVVSRDGATMLTAEGAGSDDFVYVMQGGRLLCYAPSQRGRQNLEPFAVMDVDKQVELYLKKAGQDDGNRRPGGR